MSLITNDILQMTQQDGEKLLQQKEFAALKKDPDQLQLPRDTMLHFTPKTQQTFIRNMLPHVHRMHASHATGTGKCHGVDTEIMLLDGSSIKVQDITTNHILIGDDNEPREVYSTTKGYGPIYTIIPQCGASQFTCNDAHILTCINVTTNKIIDVPLNYLLALCGNTNDFRLFKTPTEFDNAVAIANSYQHGYWLKNTESFVRADLKSRRSFVAGVFDALLSDKMTIEVPTEECANLCHVFDSIGLWATRMQSHSDQSVSPDKQQATAIIKVTGDMSAIPAFGDLVKFQKSSEMRFEIKLLSNRDAYYGFTLSNNGRYKLYSGIITHNTTCGITTAMPKITQFRELYPEDVVKKTPGYLLPSIFVLGFDSTKKAFINDLLKRPEFGMISHADFTELTARASAALTRLPDAVTAYKEFKTKLKQKITNKKRGGFFVFLGLTELVNKLFHSETITLAEIEESVSKSDDPTKTLEAVIKSYIDDGTITVNQRFLQSFTNSLIICDEVHNTYNMNIKNNRGVAIQYIVDMIKSCDLLTLSATPINNAPSEIVELLNYHLPSPISKVDFFNNNKLREGALEKLGQLSIGKYSFLQDANVKLYPKRVMCGQPYVLPSAAGGYRAGETIHYLNFVPCVMSQFHQETLTSYLRENEKIPTDGHAIYDIAFPGGVWRSSDAVSRLQAMDASWREENGVVIKKTANAHVICGDFCLRENIGKYSTKFATLIDEIIKICRTSGGDRALGHKILIYHERIKMSGVMFIQELLTRNGVLNEHMEPADNTICRLCGMRKMDHTKKTLDISGSIKNKTKKSSDISGAFETTNSTADNSIIEHDFSPLRMTINHSELDKALIDTNYTVYNSPENTRGDLLSIYVGSRKIGESLEFQSTQYMIILSKPLSIPRMIQIFGRCVRRGVHLALPPSERYVNVTILVSTVDPMLPNVDLCSPEIIGYATKMQEYLTIQLIEREFNKNAIDGPILSTINFSPDMMALYTVNGNVSNILGNLPFKPLLTVDTEKISDFSFKAHRYHEEEIRLVTYLIKRAFLQDRVWDYERLLAYCHEPPFQCEYNTRMISVDNYNIALFNMVDSITRVIQVDSQSIINRDLFDHNERYIVIGGARHRIVQSGKYYVLCPVESPIVSQVNLTREQHILRDREQNLIRQLEEPKFVVFKDAGSFLKRHMPPEELLINVNKYVDSALANSVFNKYLSMINLSSPRDFLFNFPVSFRFAYIERALKANKIDPIIQMMIDLDCIVTADEVKKYRLDKTIDIAKQKYVGVVRPNSIKILLADGSWTEVELTTMNRHEAWRDNTIIVGILEENKEIMVFKLRKPTDGKRRPAQEVTNSEKVAHIDMRNLETGMICASKEKSEILSIASALGIRAKGKLQRGSLCQMIRDKLMDLEIKERLKRTSKIKYIYF